MGHAKGEIAIGGASTGRYDDDDDYKIEEHIAVLHSFSLISTAREARMHGLV